MANQQKLKQAIVQSAKIQSAITGKTVAGVLVDLMSARFTTDFATGRTVVSTAEAGGSTSFAVPQGMQIDEYLCVVNDALQWVKKQADPYNPPLPPCVMYVRASFGKAQTS